MRRAAFAGALVLLGLAGCNEDPTSPDVEQLEVIDVVVGTGATATAGKVVTVHYTGWLYRKDGDHRGQKFDSSVDRGQPIEFTLGVRDVIAGWDQGVAGMKVGGRRTLIIPSRLAYGPYGNGPIPPGAALVFDVELLAVR